LKLAAKPSVSEPAAHKMKLAVRLKRRGDAIRIGVAA
jgi:hypothetical protein